MYSLVLVALMAQGAEGPAAGDLPGSAAVAPPGAVGDGDPSTQPQSSQKSSGFFKRLFKGHSKDTPTKDTSAASTASKPTVAGVPAPAPKPQGGFFHNFFKCNEYDKVSFDDEKKWEKRCLGGPD